MERRDPEDAATVAERWLRAVVRRDLTILPAGVTVDAHTAGDEAAFRAHCDARLDRHGRVMSAVICAFTLLWWPTDPLVAGAIPGALYWMAAWRAVVAPLTGLHALWPRPSWVSRNPGIPMFALAVACPMAMGFTAGRMGGPDRPWIHLLHVMVFATMVLPLTLRRRALVTAVVSSSTFAGFLLSSPSHARSAYFPLGVSFELCTFALSMAFGHAFWLLSRENFVQARQLGRQAVALKGYSARLEDRVERQADELQRLLRDVEASREEERRRIAHELHDELGQELAALRYALRFTRKRFGAEPTAVGPNLASLDELVERLAHTTRQIVSSLRPRVLDDLGLCAALEWLVARSEASMGVTCALTREGGDEGVPQACAAAVFRVAQESLTNVAKHARASRVEVALRVGDDRLELTVRDDGVGFDATRAGSGGLGLVGMRERAESLGGTLRVDSRVGGGTALHMRVPLAAAEH